MLAADLHRKVTHENFSLEHEDLLTAEVFGALQYLPRSFLASVLAEAARRSPRSFEGIDPVGFSEECQFTFWPKYELVEESRRTIVIPDVVLKSPDRAVVIECKLGARLDEAQLVRELKAVRAKTPKSCVLAVTTGVVQSLRLDVFIEKAKALGSDEWDAIAWLGWPLIAAAIESQGRQADGLAPGLVQLWTDLLAILHLRNLRLFQGFSRLLRQMISKPEGQVFLQDGVNLRSAQRFGGFGEHAGRATRSFKTPVFLQIDSQNSLLPFRGFRNVATRPVGRTRWLMVRRVSSGAARFNGFPDVVQGSSVLLRPVFLGRL